MTIHFHPGLNSTAYHKGCAKRELTALGVTAATGATIYAIAKKPNFAQTIAKGIDNCAHKIGSCFTGVGKLCKKGVINFSKLSPAAKKATVAVAGIGMLLTTIVNHHPASRFNK